MVLVIGIKVPEEFEIITSDDSQVIKYTRPNLTSINQPVYDIGAIAMRMLTKKLCTRKNWVIAKLS